MLKVIAIVLLVIGEALSIYAEMLSIKSNSFIKMFVLITVAGGLLIAGYMIGYKAFKNIWIVGAISITSILIVEPALAYLFFQQLPKTGALVGLIMGTIGLIFSIAWK